MKTMKTMKAMKAMNLIKITSLGKNHLHLKLVDLPIPELKKIKGAKVLKIV